MLILIGTLHFYTFLHLLQEAIAKRLEMISNLFDGEAADEWL